MKIFSRFIKTPAVLVVFLVAVGNGCGDGEMRSGVLKDGAAQDAAGDGATGARDGAVPGPVGRADFDARCALDGTLVCVGFDDADDIGRTWGANSGTLTGSVPPTLDPAQKASGASSLMFTIPSNSGAGASGSYWTNFSKDLSVQFGENATFYVQWRQRFSKDFLETDYQGGGGWKHVIIGTGDHPGCTESTATSIGSGGHCASSCTALETVVQNTGQRGFAQMYNSCTGSASHGPYAPFEEPFEAYDFKLQNARLAPHCLYSQAQGRSYFPPTGNCFGYQADEWMTFQVAISTGPRSGDEWVNSYIRMWIAREGEPSELAVDWGPWGLSTGNAEDNERYGKVWLLPYHTGKDSSQSHPTGYTWYDELIVSRNPIPDPA